MLFSQQNGITHTLNYHIMKTIINIIALLVALNVSTLQAQEIPLSTVESELGKQIEKLLKETGIPSISMAIFNNDSILLTQAYGFSNVANKTSATPQTIYHTGSTFKTITATAIMQLCESEQIDLDTPVNDYLKEDSINTNLDCDCPVTMRHLLNHQSGLSGNTELISLWDRKELKSLSSIAKAVKQTKEPGKEFEYCNHCYAIAALVLEKILATDFTSYIAENVMESFQITSNPFKPNPEMLAIPYKLEYNKPIHGNYVRFDVYPAGDAYLNPSAMAKLLMPQINKGKYKEASLLKENSVVEMQSGNNINTEYGFGQFLNSLDAHKTISHGGTLPGFTAYYLIDIDTKIGIYLMSNAEEVRQILEELSKYAIRLMNGNEDIKPLPSFRKMEKINISESILQSYTGKYELAPDIYAAITKEEGKLFVQITGQPRFDIFPYESTKFSLKVMDAQIEFVKKNDGQVNELILFQGANKVPGKRVE